MKVYTNIKTLKKAYAKLKEFGLLNLLISGKNENIDFVKMLNCLIEQNGLVDFLQIVTNDDKTDFENYEFEQAVAIIADFFGVIGKSLKTLGVQKNQKIVKE